MASYQQPNKGKGISQPQQPNKGKGTPPPQQLTKGPGGLQLQASGVPTPSPQIVFLPCKLFAETASKYPTLTAKGGKLEEFYKAKIENINGIFGSTDKAFKSKGQFGSALPGIKHAHLTHDISIVYRISGRNPHIVELFGLFSHDALGTGQPENIKRQKSMAKVFSNQEFPS